MKRSRKACEPRIGYRALPFRTLTPALAAAFAIDHAERVSAALEKQELWRQLTDADEGLQRARRLRLRTLWLVRKLQAPRSMNLGKRNLS